MKEPEMNIHAIMMLKDVECEPRALLCPSCGAAIKRGQLRCDYCMTEFVYR